MFKSYEDMQKLSREQIEAISVSASALTKGFQQIASEATDYSKKSFEASTGLFEKLAGIKTIDKAIEAQTEFAKSAYEGFVAQATKMGEICSSIAKEAYKPVEDVFAKAQAVAK